MKILKLVFSAVLVICCLFIYLFDLFNLSSINIPFDYIRSSRDKQFINFAEIEYLIPNLSCFIRNSSIVLIITSFAGNVDARNSIRRAYPKSELSKLNITRIFLLAALRKGQSKVTQNDIDYENNYNKDILQGNFLESYRNLSYKHLMGLEWASKCPYTRYIVKMDDDIVVDLYKLITVIKLQEIKGKVTLMGYAFEKQKARRDKNSKWYVSKKEFEEEYYPQFLSGWLYVTTPEVATQIVHTTKRVPLFWIDDVYVTGLLAREVDIPHQNISEYFSPFTELLDCCIRSGLACKFLAGPSNGYYAMHNTFKKLVDKCRSGLCHNLPAGKLLEDICVVKWQLPIDIGKPIVKSVQL